MSTGQHDILTRIHAMPPVDTKFVAGLWHRDRINHKSFLAEARVLLKSLTTPKIDNRRFLIVGRARSGTTLLTRLLDGQSRIHCDDEVLHANKVAPRLYFHGLARKSGAPVYGAKLLSYQMVQVHRMRDPGRFLRRLADDDVLLIHLERGTFFQTLSLTVAQSRRQFHSDLGARAPREKMRFDPANFCDRLAWNEALLDYERAAFEGIDHMYVNYERDLSDPDSQIATLGRICARLGLDAEPVNIPLEKVLPADPAAVLDNYDDICAMAEARGLGHLLPGGGPSGVYGTAAQ